MSGADVVEELRELARSEGFLEAFRCLVVLPLQIIELRLIERALRFLQRIGWLRMSRADREDQPDHQHE
jgi:hypothetical protein